VAKHTPIIPFTAKFLTENDVDFLINVLRNFGSYQNESFNITIDGKQYKSPLTAHQILYNLLIRFGGGAEQTGNQFVFDFGKKSDGSTDFSKIRATEWGTGNPIEPFDLTTDDGLNRLKKYLLGEASVWYQNEDMLTAGTTSALDSTPQNPFSGIEQFFKDHPDVNQIKYSDSLVFDRSDVDPNGDGSYSGMSGFAWAVKHGWMTTNYNSMQLPLMSTTDVEELTPAPESDPEDKPIVPSTPETPDKPVSPAIQNPIDDTFDSMFDTSQGAELGGTWEDIQAMINGINLNKVQSRSERSSLDREQAERRLRRILGKNFPVRFIENVVATFADGSEAVGVMGRAGIILSQYAKNGVEFHEAFHAIVELMLPERARKRLYDHY